VRAGTGRRSWNSCPTPASSACAWTSRATSSRPACRSTRSSSAIPRYRHCTAARPAASSSAPACSTCCGTTDQLLRVPSAPTYANVFMASGQSRIVEVTGGGSRHRPLHRARTGRARRHGRCWSAASWRSSKAVQRRIAERRLPRRCARPLAATSATSPACKRRRGRRAGRTRPHRRAGQQRRRPVPEPAARHHATRAGTPSCATTCTAASAWIARGLRAVDGGHGGAIVNMVADMWTSACPAWRTPAPRVPACCRSPRRRPANGAMHGVRVNAVAPGSIIGSGLRHRGRGVLGRHLQHSRNRPYEGFPLATMPDCLKPGAQ
jgi:hypothetical protein